MTQIDVDYDKKFLKEKRKLQRKCPSIESDFEDFKKALMADIKYNNYTVSTENDKYFRISGFFIRWFSIMTLRILTNLTLNLWF